MIELERSTHAAEWYDCRPALLRLTLVWSGQMQRDDWRELAAKELKGGDPATLDWATPEGIDVHPLYTSDDLEGIDHLDSLPGFTPFVRGVRATMYANRPWTVRQYAGFSTAEDSNAF